MKTIIITISISLLLFSCSNEQNSEQLNTEVTTIENVVQLTDKQIKNANVKTGKLSNQNISSVIKLNGKIDVPPQNMVSISIPLGGYLKSTKLLPGMHINKGEVIGVIEDISYIQLQQDYLTTKAQLTMNESEYNRQKSLNQSKATSDKVFEQTKANYQTQQILMKSLEEKLKLIGINPKNLTADNISNSINIYSPITGYVSSVNVNIGKYVTPSDILFELVNPEDIHLALTVFDKDISKLSIGQKLFAYTNSNPDKKYSCEIILVSKNLTNNNSTQVHCHFDQYDKNLLPGMFMNAEVELTNNNSIALPDEAIVRFENKHYAFISINKNKFEMKEVKTGNSENGYTEIIDSDDLINQVFVTKGAYNLLMALKNKSEE